MLQKNVIVEPAHEIGGAVEVNILIFYGERPLST